MQSYSKSPCRRRQNIRKQYIATVNHDQLEAMRSEFSPGEFRALFEEQTIVLRLKDDGDKSKLLGMQVDMKYH
ncbi:MAG: DUF2326 domain-containing protein [Nitrosomonas sp.]|nr:DUF2326 domain-containing protein [Nitrosomonas sp.]